MMLAIIKYYLSNAQFSEQVQKQKILVQFYCCYCPYIASISGRFALMHFVGN